MASLEKVKSGDKFIVYRNGDQLLIKIEDVRFSYPHFGVKRKDEGDDGQVKESWGGVAMLSKKTHVAAKEAFVEIMNGILANIPNERGGRGIKLEPQYKCIKSGDDKEDENMHDHWLINFSDSNRRPAVRDQKGNLMTDEILIDDKFYGGCYGSVLLRPWFFNGKRKNSSKTYPKRVCAGFTGVQFLRDGEPFGNSRINDDEAWGDESDGGGSNDETAEDDI